MNKALYIATSALLVGIFSLGCQPSPPARPASLGEEHVMVTNGTYQADQLDKLKAITKIVVKNGALTEEDFRYAVEQLDAPSKDPGMVRMYVGGIIGAIRKPTEGQKPEIREIARRLMASSDEREQRSGLYIAITTDDSELLKDVLPLSRSENENMKEKALEFIKKHDR